MKRVHLIANAHLDPMWLWRWQEGCSETLSTFRTAAELTDEFEGFVFNHNESLLYEWVKNNSPSLFEKLKQAVRENKWHIMGGWYLQPDCNMPSGESIVRNIEKGKRFFKKEFNQEPTTAINFDPFGHSKGLVQILKQANYDSYVVCRPGANDFPFENQDFVWEGLNDSEIIVHRSDENYNSVWGHVAEELMEFLPKKESEEVTLFLWGVGDHGGGPSRKDLQDLKELIEKDNNYCLIHSTPEAYFAEMKHKKDSLPRVKEGLNPVAPGCYTSQIRVKQKHRELENEIYSAEKMAAAAQVLCNKEYPKKKFEDAMQALLFSEFHDALPGSGSPLVEEDTLRGLDYGLEIMSRIKHYSALALARGERRVEDGTSVILFYNPHPYDITGVFECETGLPKQNWTTDFMYPIVKFNGEEIPCQAEKECSNFSIDWRKKIVVQATLKAFSVNRMDVYYKPLPKRPVFDEIVSKPEYVFDNGSMKVVIDTRTGLLKEYSVNGKVHLTEGSMQLACLEDIHNPWGIKQRWEAKRRDFQLLSNHAASEYCGLKEKVIPAVRVIEDGAARTTVEAVFGLEASRAYVRYKLPKQGDGFEVEVGVHFMEKEHSLKLMFQTPDGEKKFHGQIMFGREELKKGQETVSQKWCMVGDENNSVAVINNGTHGADLLDNELGITLLRSAGYTASDFVMGKALQEEQWAPRMEQGERFYKFYVQGGTTEEMNKNIDRMAQQFNEQPYGFSYCPPGEGEPVECFMKIDNPRVMVSAIKRSEDSNGYIVRLYEGSGEATTAMVAFPALKQESEVSFNGFEIKTFLWNPENGDFKETNLIEGGAG